jgi:hypothetical protein
VVGDEALGADVEYRFGETQRAGDNRFELPRPYTFSDCLLVKTAPLNRDHIAKTDETGRGVTERRMDTSMYERHLGTKACDRVSANHHMIGWLAKQVVGFDGDAVRTRRHHLVYVDFKSVSCDQAGGFDVAVEPRARQLGLARKSDRRNDIERHAKIRARNENVCVSKGPESWIVVEAMGDRRTFEQARVDTRLRQAIEAREHETFNPQVERELHLVLENQFVVLAFAEVEDSALDRA